MRQRTLVYYTFESYWQESAKNPTIFNYRKATDGERVSILITLKSRLAIAAAAIAARIMIRSKPLVFLPLLPSRNGSIPGISMMKE